MAVDAPKQGTRRASRLKVAGRLFALLGLPLMVIFGIFAGGVYVGALRSYRVQVLEAAYLGFEPPPAPSDTATPIVPTSDATPEPKPDAKPPEPKPDAKPPDAKPPEPKPDLTQPPQPDTTTEPKPSIAALPTATADPVGAELRKQFDAPLRVRVKLLVDPGLVASRPDWLSYAASLIDAANASFEVLFGVEVQLQGVVIWSRPAGADPAALLADLRERDRDGADVVLGLVAGTAPDGYVAQTWPTAHGDHGLVFADLRTRDRYYLNLLRTLAGLLGATPTQDDTARQLGSFMSDAEPAEGAAPVLDPENRGRVVFNKPQPFADSRIRPAQPQPQPQGDDI